MSIYDKASLVLIPSGTKTSKVYSQKPVSGDGDFTFSRSTAATRVNASGNIEKETQNLLLQSNNFSSGFWPIVNATITGGQSGYDGSSDAWLLSATNNYANVYQTISGTGVLTFSCYAKAGTSNWMMLRLNGSSNNLIYFDVANGVLGTIVSSNYIDSNIEALPNGWFRISITINQTSYSTCNIYVAAADNDLITTNQTIYIQDAQLEQGLVARDYIETTTAAVEGGITDNVPRLDYTDSSCPALLLEPQRTNLVSQSEFFDGGSDWGRTRCGFVTNTSETLSPEGLYNASKMTSTDINESYAQDDILVSGSTSTWSFFAKKGDLDYCHGLVWDRSANGCRQWFNLSTGAVGGTTTFGSGYSVSSASIEDFGNGWYRCTMIVSVTAGANNGYRISLSDNNSSTTSPVNSYGYFYGTQLEDASYATSYIPTYGSAVTRNIEDLGNILLPEFDDENNYSVMFELTRKGISSAEIADFFEFRKTNFTKVVKLWVDAPSAQVRFRDDVQGSATMSTIPFAAGDTKKICVVCNGTTFKTFVDGALDETYNIVTPLSLSRFYMTAKSFDMKQLLVFKTSLTDQEAIDLTTL